MIPDIDILSETITQTVHPSRTYKIVIDHNKIKGYTNDLDAVAQAVYIILNTERYEYPIYSWDYGVELCDLFGKPVSYVMAELPRRVKDALTTDNRISDVTDFQFEQSGNSLHTRFTVVSDAGNISTDLEVSV